LFYRGSVLANLLPVEVVTKTGSLSTLSLSQMVTVGTLNQGYPLLQHEDAAPVRHLQATRRTAPDPTA
jgi:hypothetical protein